MKITIIARRFFVLSLLLCFAAGCGKPGQDSQRTNQAKPAKSSSEQQFGDLIVRCEWPGKKRIQADTNYAYLTQIWSLPASERLEAQVLDKFALAPWIDRALATNLLLTTNLSALVHEHPHARQLRPLVQNVLDLGCTFEVRRMTNGPFEFAMAVKLDKGAEALWKSHLSGLSQSLPGMTLQVSHKGEWTLVGWTSARTNHALVSMLSNPGTEGSNAGKAMVKMFLDFQKLDSLLVTTLLKTPLGTNLPALTLTLAGDGEYIRTRGTFKFRQPVPLSLEPWQIPTNLIREPLTSFCAVRGIRPWLETNPLLGHYNLSAAPNQFFTWSLRYSPVHIFTAMPYAGASDWLQKAGPEVPAKSLGWLTNYARGTIEYVVKHNALSWDPMPIFAPVLESKIDSAHDYLLARLSAPIPPIGSNAPPELFQKLNDRRNLVYYDWEFTDSKVEQWFFLGQSLRLLFWCEQLPDKSSSTAFLQAAGPKLGNTVTEIIQVDPYTFTLARGSHIGFSGLELHLLADWFESPEFPAGTHTLLAPRLSKGNPAVPK